MLIIGVVLIWVVPVINSHETDPAVMAGALKRMSLLLVGTICVFQLFTGIVQAVSYSLLRGDKDGVSNEELAKVFE